MKKALICTSLLLCMFGLNKAFSVEQSSPVLRIELNVPKLNADPYHRPYIAVWLESMERKPITTLHLWTEKPDWLKDLRQWWRKIGRSHKNIDGITGATRKPGKYSLEWDGKSEQGEAVAPGDYLLNIEAAREEGGRSYIRQRVTLGEKSLIEISAKEEIGAVTIETVKVSK